jgi:DNA-binding NarL/FixJ family response regulator
MDIAMPHLNGYETTCWLTKNHPSVKVLAVSKHDRESTINYIIGCGAKGFMSKYDGIDELIRAIENVYKNKFYLSSSKQTASLLHSLPGSKYAREKLTAREREFMRLLCTEKTYQEIANEMSINLGTAYSYRNSLFHKFQVNSREQVLFCCLNEGLVFL